MAARARKRPLSIPDMAREQALGGVVAGVDEAGRAPLAGPVVAAAVVLPEDAAERPELEGLTDSKQLTAADRERLFGGIRAIAEVGVGAAGAREIDRLNILNATMAAMDRALRKLEREIDAALIDGNRVPQSYCRMEPVVGGDCLSLSIAAASVVAKVLRDRAMARLARRWPGYGWERNAGYGTDEHYLGLMRLGPTPHHRMSFTPLTTLFADRSRRYRFVAIEGTPDILRMELVRLREDLHAVLDRQGRHLGVVKYVPGKRRWLFKAIGYDAAGQPLPGGGPFGAVHDSVIGAPSTRALIHLFRKAGC